MKRNILCVIAIIAGIVACTPEYKPNYPVFSWDNEPVVMAMDPATSLPVVITTDGVKFYVPDLLEKIDFHEGDYYLVAFKYDTGNQDMEGVATASDFKVISIFQKVTTTAVADGATVADAYNEPVAKIAYGGTIGSCHFFECIQSGAEKQTYAYESIYVPELNSDRTVTVYIRAQKTEPVLPSATDATSVNYIGVDITSLKSFYRENGFKKITVTYKCKSADDVQGEIYEIAGYQDIDL